VSSSLGILTREVQGSGVPQNTPYHFCILPKVHRTSFASLFCTIIKLPRFTHKLLHVVSDRSMSLLYVYLPHLRSWKERLSEYSEYTGNVAAKSGTLATIHILTRIACYRHSITIKYYPYCCVLTCNTGHGSLSFTLVRSRFTLSNLELLQSDSISIDK
jgi:hypothetical protein